MILQISNPPAEYSESLARIAEQRIVSRIWAGDYTVWSNDPEEITNRLAWIRLPETMMSGISRLRAFAEAVCSEGFTDAVILGMGGSSLAPGMFAKILGTKEGFVRVRVLDSTHPQTVQRVRDDVDLDRTLFIVATKSGTTTETLSLFRYFYRQAVERVGLGAAGKQFIAITDPGTTLVDLAHSHGFREVFLNEPHVGGRYSALSLVGLVPAALLGLDLQALLESARTMSQRCSAAVDPQSNPAVELGCLLGASALRGRDKVTLCMPPSIESFGDWVEQLIAESSGKDGRGIVPVVERALGDSSSYGDDRLFVMIERSNADRTTDWVFDSPHPVIRLPMNPSKDLFAHCLLWEHAVAIACHILGVHPFNQPNVESAKRWAKHVMDEFRQTGSLPELHREPLTPQSLEAFLENLHPGNYVALQAYLPESAELTASLVDLQAAIRDRYSIAVTIGYGPRFLHSTGQLHKGDRGNGRFVQLVSEGMPEVPIPDSLDSTTSLLSFGSLITSQALGDRRALEDAGRPVRTLGVPEPLPRAVLDTAHQIART